MSFMSSDSIENGTDSYDTNDYTYDDDFFTPNKNIDITQTKRQNHLLTNIKNTEVNEQIFPMRKAVSCTTCDLYDSNTKVSRNQDGGFGLRRVASCSICAWDLDEFTEDDFNKSSVSDDSYEFGQTDENINSTQEDDISVDSLDKKSFEDFRPRLQRSNSYTKAMDEDDVDNQIDNENTALQSNIKVEIEDIDGQALLSASSPSFPRLPPDGGESIMEDEQQSKIKDKNHEKLIITSSSKSGKTKNSKSPFRLNSFKRKDKQKKSLKDENKKQNSLDRIATEELDEIFGKLKKTPENSFDRPSSEEEDDKFNLSFSNDSFLTSSSSSSPKKFNKKIFKRLLPPKSLRFNAKKDSKLSSQRSKSVEFLYTNEPLFEDVNITKSFSSMELALCGVDEDEIFVDNINEQWISYLKKIGGMTIFGGNESLRYVWYQINSFQKDLLQHFQDFLKQIIDDFQQAYMKCQDLEAIITLKTEQQERETSKIYDDVERAMQEEREKLEEKHSEKEDQIRNEFIKMFELKDQEIQDLHKQNTDQTEKFEKLQNEYNDLKHSKEMVKSFGFLSKEVDVNIQNDIQVVSLTESEHRLREHVKALEEELLLMHGRLNEELTLRKDIQDNLEIMTETSRQDKENYKQCLRRCQDLLEEKEFLDVSINNLSTEVEELKQQQQQQKYNHVKTTPNGLQHTPNHNSHVNSTLNNIHVEDTPNLNETFDENCNHPALGYRRSMSPNSETSSTSTPSRPTTPVIQTPSGFTPLRPRLHSIEQSKNLLTSTIKKHSQYRNTAQTPIKLASSKQTDFKVIFTGDCNVGKTSLIRRIVKGKFRANREITLESDFSEKTLEYNGEKVNLKLWDTVGQERFNSIPTSYFRRSDVVLLMYDVSDDNSFYNARTWIKTIHENTNENIFLLLVGNKADLHHKRQISVEKGKLLAKDHDAMFIETSAKSGENIKQLCDMIASTLLERDDTVVIRNNFEDSFLCSLTSSQRRFKHQSNNICCQ